METDTFEKRENPFTPLAKMLPDERYDEIGSIFDAREDSRVSAGDEQWKLSGLAMLLHCLESWPDDNTTLSVPILRTLQALEAAYSVGRLAAVRELQEIAKEITSGRFCRLVDHQQGMCDCQEIADFVLSKVPQTLDKEKA